MADMSVFKRNNALDLNGFTNTVTTDNHITDRGSDWYFAVCAVMWVSAIAIMGLAYKKHQSQRLFHYITATIVAVAGVAYFCMGANLGWTGIQVEFVRSDPKVSGTIRQIFYVRYIDWVITTPLLLLDILLTCGLPAPTIAYVVIMNELMVVTGLVGSLVKSRYKWAFFTFGCVAFFFVAYQVVIDGRKHARALGNDILKVYTLCGAWTISLWTLYPIAWGLCEGGNLIPSDSEAIFYGVLDLLAKPGFGALLLWGHRNIDLARLGLHIKNPGETGTPGGEKRTANHNANVSDNTSSEEHTTNV